MLYAVFKNVKKLDYLSVTLVSDSKSFQGFDFC